jgi:Ca-activated chloride channel family protein
MSQVRLRSLQLCAALICVLGSAAFGHSTSQRAVAIQDKNDAVALNAKGLEFSKLGLYEQAIPLFKEAVKRKKDYAEAHANLGDAYFQSGDYRKAVEAYKQVVKYQSSSATDYDHLGLAYFRLGEHKKAVDAFKEAIRLDPKYSSAFLNLGTAYADRDKDNEALAQYQILKTLDPELAKKLYLVIYKPAVAVYGSESGVRLNVIATDGQGNLIADLKKDDFQVSEDNVPHVINSFSTAQFPIVCGLAVDTSGSMRPVFPEVLEVAKAIIQSSRPEDETLLIRFIASDKIETTQEFTSDKRKLLDGLDTMYVELGQSAIVDAVYLAAQHSAQYKPDSASYLRRVVIVLTDGDERASYYDLKDLVNLLRQIDVQVFAVCLSKEEGPGPVLNSILANGAESLLKMLAKETGGYAFFPKTISELSSVTKQLTAMIHTQYFLAYKPTKPWEVGSHHRINVAFNRPGAPENLKALARSGYVVAETKRLPPP